MKFRLGGALAVLCLLWAGAPAWAHHSVQAQFDLDKPITVAGVVTKVEWINPHSYLYLDTKDNTGKVKHWAFEMAGPGALRKAGLSRADRGGLKAGDSITINGVAPKMAPIRA
jgi:DNA/RNA endonuclease YhcR with UshA esterase domain